VSSQGETVTRPKARPSRLKRRWWLGALALCALIAVVVTFRALGHGALASGEQVPGVGPGEANVTAPQVEVVAPRTGGIERVTVQPGSVHSFESVELYAMVSGYLKTQNVDIGSRVKKGQVVAVLDVPREENAVNETAALLDQAKVRARLAEAKVKSMEADRDTAAATVAQTEADIGRLAANLKLANAQYLRVKSLFEKKAVDKRLVDEQLRDFESAGAAERTAHLAVLTAKSQLAGATAKIEQARVDVAEAQAAVGVTETRLAKARVDLGYAKIVAPFDGVVTHRNFHPGAFIRSASDGSQLPLLTVARIDLMRVVVRIPDRDVVLADQGDPVVLTIDGLEGRTFRGTVSRIAGSEDPTTRTMRVEIDLPNPDGLLRAGMYGRASIGLEATSTRLTVPVACVLDRSGKGRGVVQVVRDGKVHRVTVELGADNGTLVEVDSGLGPNDVVVLRSAIPLEEGMAVDAKAAG
jgi:HlyD family secretion protein